MCACVYMKRKKGGYKGFSRDVIFKGAPFFSLFMSNYYFVIVGATDNPIYEAEIIPSSRSNAFADSNRVNKHDVVYLGY